MPLIRIARAEALKGYRLRLTLTDGSVIERDVGHLLVGPVFDAVRSDPAMFAQVRVEHGTVVWPGEADLCPDVLVAGTIAGQPVASPGSLAPAVEMT